MWWRIQEKGRKNEENKIRYERRKPEPWEEELEECVKRRKKMKGKRVLMRIL